LEFRKEAHLNLLKVIIKMICKVKITFVRKG